MPRNQEGVRGGGSEARRRVCKAAGRYTGVSIVVNTAIRLFFCDYFLALYTAAFGTDGERSTIWCRR